LNAKKKQELGQYRTPERIASFMASLFEVYPTEVRLLDAGAGDGTLTAAFVKRFCDSRHRSKRLAMLGLEVSTGRVVDFRAKEFLVREAHEGTVPLIYPCHFKGSFVHWPNPGGRKPNAIRDTERTQELLVPGAICVLVKRFTSKEERRRVVACIYDAHRIHAERVGFENHLNYFHARGRGLPTSLAKGLRPS